MSTSKAQPKNLDAWLKELDGVRLPVSSDNHRRAVSALRNSNSSLREIAEQLQQSPALALVININRHTKSLDVRKLTKLKG